MLTPEESRQYLLTTLKSLGQDRSWRVRYMVATHFDELCEAFGESITREEMVTLFVSLIKDSEGEVKILSIGQAPGKGRKCLIQAELATNIQKNQPFQRKLINL
jgi:serine/threonine-protein phosphatase 2A regulatory subunit A